MRKDDKRFYVYVFFNTKWNEIFYVGKGTGNRINDLDRNKHVAAILNNYPCEKIKIVDGLDSDTALDIEHELKEHLISLGKPIIDYERRYTSYGQMRGIEEAKKRGAYKGRKPIEIDSTKFILLMNEYYKRKTTKGAVAKALGISRPTLDKFIEEYKNAITV